jgi:hypothetical protein
MSATVVEIPNSGDTSSLREYGGYYRQFREFSCCSFRQHTDFNCAGDSMFTTASAEPGFLFWPSRMEVTGISGPLPQMNVTTRGTRR